jgi:hypothetical protein
MLSSSQIQQRNVSRWACHSTMKVVSEDSACSMVGVQGQLARTCAEVSTGSVEALKANLGFRCHMAPKVNNFIVVTRSVILQTSQSIQRKYTQP